MAKATATVATPPSLPRRYETIYILKPGVDPDDADKVASRFSEIVDKFGGKITKVDSWGKRKLAYLIQKHSRGIFIHVDFVGANKLVAELERNLRRFDDVIRYQTIRIEDDIDINALEINPEETKFERIEPGEEEVELTRAQRLGIDIRTPSPSQDAAPEPASNAAPEPAAASASNGESADSSSAEGATDNSAPAASAEGAAPTDDQASADATNEKSPETTPDAGESDEQS